MPAKQFLARHARHLIRLAVIAIVIAGVAIMVRGLELGKLATVVSHARWLPILGASAIAIAVYVFKALSWRIMMEPQYHVPVVRLLRYTIIAFAVSAITPARAGEAVRVWLLKQRDGVDTATSVAVATSEKALDALSLFILAAPLPWLLDVPSWVDEGLWAIGGAVVIGVPLVIVASSRVSPTSWLGRFLAALERRPRTLFLATAMLLAGWLIDLVAVVLVFYALDMSIPWSGALLVMFVVNVTIALPTTPAHVGTFEVGVLLVLVDILHVPREPAVAFALVYHATQSLATVLLGLVLEWRLVLGLDGRPAPPTDTAPRAGTCTSACAHGRARCNHLKA